MAGKTTSIFKPTAGSIDPRWILAATFIAAASQLLAADYFVATSGKDGSAGKSPQTPFKSLAAACRLIPRRLMQSRLNFQR